MSELFQLLQSNPIVGFSGIVASILGFIIGIPLTIYLYRRGNKKRGLTYMVRPTRTQIVRAGAASRLSVVHNGREIKSDITAVHIAIWNQGRESIREANMLRPMTIQTEGFAPILEASIHMATRDVIRLRLDESKCSQGCLGVSWDILEERDGGVVQIIYAGPPELHIIADAIPEDQREIIGIDLSHVIPPVPGAEKIPRLMVMILLCLSASVVLELLVNVAQIGGYLQSTSLMDRRPVKSWEYWLVGLNAVVLVGGFALIPQIISRLRQMKPPFEF
jgi:hypothetical protein